MPAQPNLERPVQETQNSIPPEQILAALDKIGASEAFGKVERPVRFLRHLVSTALQGDSRVLKESVLGIEVFERPASWDPRLDPVVRQEAARLRKRLAKYYETSGAADELRIELPVGSYVPVFRRQNVESQPPPSEIPLPLPPGARQRKLLPYIALGVLCTGIALVGWRVFTREPQRSIVVLPFTNLSKDRADLYFSDGLTDEITDSLVRVKGLRVIARSSAIRFQGKPVDLQEVGRLLHVSDVIEGSIERSGDRIKVIAHLERVSDGSLLWSNSYERRTADLFAIQSELAAGIAGGLKAAAGDLTGQHVPHPEAYDFYMKGRYELRQVTPESVTQAELDFHHAIDSDPQYAAAYVGLATAKFNQSIARGSTSQTDSELREVERLLRKAADLDPGLPTAHATLAILAMQYDRDWARAGREFRLALAGPSSASTERNYAFFLLFHGKYAEADRHFAKMAELDPFSANMQSNLALARQLEGRFAEARAISQKAASENPKMLWTQQLIGLSYVEDGHPEFALPIFKKLEQQFPAAQVCEAMALAKAGRKEEALRLIRPYEDPYPNRGIAMEWLALVYAFLGDEPNTLKWLQRSSDQHEFQVLSLAVDPAFAAMRNSPDFRALEKRVGLDE